MYKILLASHLIGSCLFLLVFIQSLSSIRKENLRYIKTAAVNIALITFFQAASGLSLAIIKFQTTSIADFCAKLGIYVFISITTEFILYRKFIDIKTLNKLSNK